MPFTFSHTFNQYKQAYSGHPKEIWTLAILTIINRSGTMVIPFMGVYITTILGFSLKEAGIITSAFGFGSLAGAFLGGRLSDRFGSPIVIVLSLAIGGMLFFCLQFVKSFEGLSAMIFLAALFGEAYRPAVSAAVGDFVPTNQTGRSMSFIRLAISLGMVVGPAVGGFVAASFGYQWLFTLDGLTCFFAAIYAFFASRNWQKRNHETEIAKEFAKEGKALAPYQHKYFLLFLLGSLFVSLASLQWWHTIPVFIKKEWGFDERYIGMMMAMSSVMMVLIEMPLTHFLEKAKKIRFAVLIGLLVIAISFVPFLFPKALFLCFLAAGLTTFGKILFLPFNNAIPLHVSPIAKRGEYMAWYWMTWSLGMIISPLAGFSFAEEFGFDTFWGALIGLVGIGFSIQIMLNKHILKGK